jgi:hypothetical protein
MKKTYLKPDAEYIRFYSDEEMTDTETNLPTVSGIPEEGTGDDSWID